ncbi:DUF5801 repeats-in-toxin domain-containing protein [Dongia deserti]|uniref:DUF5801 repeats-in-toxin domain-containing protein n=1 Tax=Dongia deserti TaxID=2268030 RepID=UPI000E64FEDD|nr:DUF5801 repeats-in-toxin domain-containing protein [Dongia deserti]
MATDSTNLPQGETRLDAGLDMAGSDLDLTNVQVAQAEPADWVDLPKGNVVILLPVQPGQTVRLPTASAENLPTKIGPEGNLAFVVDGRTIILQGYLSANEQSPVKIVTSDGDSIDVAELIAATDPSLDIVTAAGPATGGQGDGAEGSGIFVPFGAGPGLGGIAAIGILDPTQLQYRLIDDERREFVEGDTEPSSIDISFDILGGIVNEDDLLGDPIHNISLVVKDVGNDGVGNDPFDTKDREEGGLDSDGDDNNGSGADPDNEPLTTIATVKVNFGPDIPGTLTVDPSQLPAGLTSEGEPIIYQVLPPSGGQGNGIVAFVDGNADGKFDEADGDRLVFGIKVLEKSSANTFHIAFTLYDNLDDEAPDLNKDGKADLLGANEQILDLPVKITAKDSDGSTKSTTMKFGVEDDVPSFGEVIGIGEGMQIINTGAGVAHDESLGVQGDADDQSILTPDAISLLLGLHGKITGEGFSLPFGDSAGALTFFGFPAPGLAQTQVIASFGADQKTQEYLKDSKDASARNSIFGELEDRTDRDGDGVDDGENEHPFELFMIKNNAVGGVTEDNLTIDPQLTNATVTWNGAQPPLPVWAQQIDAHTVVGYVEVNGVKETVFVLNIDDNGVLSFVQLHQINHPDTTNHDEPFPIKGADGQDLIHVRISDYDGDHAHQPVNIVVQDDGPKFIKVYWGLDGDSTSPINGIGRIDEDWLKDGNKDFALGDDLGKTHADGTVIFDFGADNPGTLSIDGLTIKDDAGNTLVTFDKDGNPVGLNNLKTSEGETILIEKSGPDGNGVVTWTGYVGDPSHKVFTFSLDTEGGEIGEFDFDLHESLYHPDNNGNPADDETDDGKGSFEDNLHFDFIVRGTDADGDWAEGSVKIRVDDDSPKFEGVCFTHGNGRVDEDLLIPGGNLGLDFGPGDESLFDGTFTSGTINFDFGADQPGKLAFGELVITDSAGKTWDISELKTADGNGIYIEISDPDPVTGVVTYKGFEDGSNDPVFTMSLDTSGKDVGDFKFTLHQALQHPYTDSDSDYNNDDNPQSRYEDNFNFAFNVIATDADKDAVQGTIKIVVDDDSPKALDDHDVVTEGKTGSEWNYASGNVVTGGDSTVLGKDSNFTFLPPLLTGDGTPDLPGADRPYTISKLTHGADTYNLIDHGDGASPRFEVTKNGGASLGAGESFDDATGILTIPTDKGGTFEIILVNSNQSLVGEYRYTVPADADHDIDYHIGPSVSQSLTGDFDTVGEWVTAFDKGGITIEPIGGQLAIKSVDVQGPPNPNYRGIGVSSGNGDEAEVDRFGQGGSEGLKLTIQNDDFPGGVNNASLLLGALFNGVQFDNGFQEIVQWQVFLNGVPVASGQIVGDFDGLVTLDIDTGGAKFNQIVLKPLDNGAPGNHKDWNSDFQLINVEICKPQDKFTEAFDYTLRDSDGDESTATLTVDVKDTEPKFPTHSAANITFKVDEDGIAGGNKDVQPGDSAESTSGGNVDNDGIHVGKINFTPGFDPVSIELTVGNGGDTGLDTVDGKNVFAAWDAATSTLIGYIEGTDPSDAANRVFTMKIDNHQTGDFTFKLLKPVKHPETDAGGANDNTENFTTDPSFVVNIQIEDKDCDVIHGKAMITIDDDMPVVQVAANSAGAVTHDETKGRDNGPGDDDQFGNPPSLFNVLGAGPAIGWAFDGDPVVNISGSKYGADGPGNTSYALDIPAGDVFSGVETTDGKDIWLFEGPNGIIVGRVGSGVDGSTPDATGAIIFAIAINSDGELILVQYDSLKHPDNPNNYDEVIPLANGALQAVVTLTDADGDSVSKSADIGGLVRFGDDGPKARIDTKHNNVVQHDETPGVQNPGSGLDMDQSDPLPAEFSGIVGALIGWAKSNEPIVTTAGTSVGSDDEGATVTLSLEVSGKGVDSGIDDTATGQNIYLFQNGSIVEGRVGGEGGPVAFAVSINQDGTINLAQFRAVAHPNPNDHDESVSIANGALKAVVTVIDGDGDKDVDSVSIGNRVRFDDDGPQFVDVCFDHGNGRVDEDLLPGGNLGLDFAPGDETLLDGTWTSGQINFSIGSDQPGTLSFGDLTITDSKGLTIPLSALKTADGNSVSIVQSAPDGNGVVTLTGIEAGSGDPVFTMTLDTSGGNMGDFKFTLNQALSHPYTDSDLNNDDNPESRYEDNLNFSFNVIAKDGDKDTAQGAINIVVDDDSPKAFDDHDVVTEGKTGDAWNFASGNVVTGGDALLLGKDSNFTFLPPLFTGDGTPDLPGADRPYTISKLAHDGTTYFLNDLGGGSFSVTKGAPAGEPGALPINNTTETFTGGVLKIPTDEGGTFEIVMVSNTQSEVGEYRYTVPADAAHDVDTLVGPADATASLALTDASAWVSAFNAGGITLEGLRGIAAENLDVKLVTVPSGPTYRGVGVDNGIDGAEVDIQGPETLKLTLQDAAYPGGVTNAKLLLGALFDGVHFDSGNQEIVKWEIWNDGVLVGSGQILGDLDGLVTLDIDTGGQKFDEIRLTPVSNGAGSNSSFNSDFLLLNVEICKPLDKFVEEFDYTLRDSDGDESTATLSINVKDTEPKLPPRTTEISVQFTVDEDGLPGVGIGDHASQDAEENHTPPNALVDDAIHIGKINFTPGFDAVTIELSVGNGGDTGLDTVDGKNVFAAWDAATSTLVGYIEGTDPSDAANRVFTMKIDNHQTGEFTFTLLKPVEHPDSNPQVPNADENHPDLSFTVNIQVEDKDCDVITGTATIKIDDDMPVITQQSGNFKLAVDESLDGNSTPNNAGDHPHNPGTRIEDDEDGAGLPGVLTGLGSVIGAAKSSGSSLFSYQAGADGLQSAVYSLTLAGGGSIPTTLKDTQSGLTISLVSFPDGTIRGIAGGHLVFALSINGTTGEVSMAQYRAVDHGNQEQAPGNHDEEATLGITGGLQVTLTVTDKDNDTVSSSADISGKITFDDDGPKADLDIKHNAKIAVDESVGKDLSDPNAHDEQATGDTTDIGYAKVAANVLFDDDSEYGTDGPGTKQFKLLINGGANSGLDDTQTNSDVLLTANGAGTLIEGRSAIDNHLVFTIAIDPVTGEVTVTQYRAVEHNNSSDPDESGSSAAVMSSNKVQVELTITDKDGDSDTDKVDLGSIIKFEDDGPTAKIVKAEGAQIVLDESTGPATGPYADPNAFDENGNVDGDIGYAKVAGNLLFVDNSDYGTDGPGTKGYTLALSSNGTNSGLDDVATGQDIRLYQVDADTVVGRVGNSVGPIAFQIDINQSTGEVTISQFRAVEHDNAGDSAATHDESGSPEIMDNDKLFIRQTITDKDGDSDVDYLDLGKLIKFEDDGPVAVDDEDSVDEDSGAYAIGNVYTGKDGGVPYGSDANLTDGNKDDVGSDGLKSIQWVDPNAIGGIDGNGNVAGLYGTLYVQTDGDYKYVLNDDHPALKDLDNGEVLYDTFSYIITDKDGDKSTATLKITINGKTDNSPPDIDLDPQNPQTDDRTAVVSDEGLTDGEMDDIGVPSDDTDSATFVGLLTVSDPDVGDVLSVKMINPGTLPNWTFSGGDSVSWVLSADGQTLTGTAGGDPAITIQLSPLVGNTASYTVTLHQPLDHPVAGQEDERSFTVPVRVTDSAGAFDTAFLTVEIEDDSPEVHLKTSGSISLQVDETLGGIGDHPDPAGTREESDETGVNPVLVIPAYGTVIGAASAQASDLLEIQPGADGELSHEYTLSVTGDGATGLTDTASGQPITLEDNGAGLILGKTAGGHVVFALTIDGTSGEISMAQYRAIVHGDTGSHDDVKSMLAGKLSVTLSVTDKDHDEASKSVDISGSISFDDDGPKLVDGAVQGSVEEDDINSIVSVGNNEDGSVGQHVAQGSLITLVNFGSDGAAAGGGFSLDPAATATLLSQNLTSKGVLLTYNIVGDTLTASAGAQTVFTLKVEADGDYTFTLVDQLDHHPIPLADNTEGFLTINLGGVVEATDKDGDSLHLGDNFSIKVQDDIPTAFDPEDKSASNKAGASVIGDLDFQGHVGADEPASITFTGFTDGDAAKDVNGDPIKSQGEAVFLYGEGTGVITGKTGDGDEVFTVTLQPGSDTYSFNLNRAIDDGGGVVFTNLSGGKAGEKEWLRIDNLDTDLLITPLNQATGNINSDTDDIGVSDQWIDHGEGVRIDFVKNPAGNQDAENGYTYGSHYLVNEVSFAIIQSSGNDTSSLKIRIVKADDDTSLEGDADDVTALLSQAGININNVSGGAAPTITDLGGGYFQINGLDDGDKITVTGDEPFNRLEIEGVNHNNSKQFSVGGLAIGTIVSGDPVTMNFDVKLTDKDGDSAAADFNVTVVDRPVTISDLTPKASGGDAVVDEEALSDGTNPGSNAEFGTGNFKISAPDGVGDLKISDGNDTITIINNGVFQAGQFIGSSDLGNKLEITGYDSGTGVVTYKYTLLDNENHPNANGQNSLFDDFTVKVTDKDGDSATGTLSVKIIDDVPVANALSKSILADTGQDTNLLITLDISGSMTQASGLTDLNKLELAIAAIKELIEQYDALGDVKVRLVTFSTNASERGDTWMTVAQVKDVLDTLSADGLTNYDEALTDAIAAFGDSGKIVGAQNVAYFLSDGNPNRPEGDAGIDAGEEATWINFLKANDVNSFALGFGAPGDVNQGAIDPIAYNGVTEMNTNGQVVTDLNLLAAALVSTVAPPVNGNLKTNGGNSIGADNPGIVSQITFGGNTFVFNGASITRTTGSLAFGVSGGGTILTFSTPNGTLQVNMSTGAYTYALLADAAASDTFGYTLTDTDGDAATSTLQISAAVSDIAPIVRDDYIIAGHNNNSGNETIVIPAAALLWNDSDANGDAISVSGTFTNVSGFNGTGVTLSSGNISMVDSSGGGTFTYTGTANGKSDTGDVVLDRSQEGDDPLEGNGLDNIIVSDDSSDALNGYEGNDVLLGGAGNDTLNGGTGRDWLVGGAGNDTMVGGAGNDLIDVSEGNDTIRYTSKLDGQDVITGFDNSGGSGNQDFIDLNPLFDSLGIATGSRTGLVNISTSSGNTIVNVDVDGVAGISAGDVKITIVGITSGITAGTGPNDDLQLGTL